MATWGSPFVDGPLSDLGPTASTKVYPCALIPDFTTRRPLGDSRSVQPWLCRPAVKECARSRRLRSELPGYGFQSGRGLVTSRQAQAKPHAEQPPLFELHEDCCPSGERDAAIMCCLLLALVG
jgi:hypothetical protein